MRRQQKLRRIICTICVILLVATMFPAKQADALVIKYLSCLGAPDTDTNYATNKKDYCSKSISREQGQDLYMEGWVLSTKTIQSYLIEFRYNGAPKACDTIPGDGKLHETDHTKDSKTFRWVFPSDWSEYIIKTKLLQNTTCGWKSTLKTSWMQEGLWIIDIRGKLSDNSTIDVAQIQLTIKAKSSSGGNSTCNHQFEQDMEFPSVIVFKCKKCGKPDYDRYMKPHLKTDWGFSGTHWISNSSRNKDKKSGDHGTGEEWHPMASHGITFYLQGKDGAGKPDRAKNESYRTIVVLRHPDPKVALRIAELGLDAAFNNHIGYDKDQTNRTTYKTILQSKGWDVSAIDVNCDADCSSGICTNIIAAGHQLLNEKSYKNSAEKKALEKLTKIGTPGTKDTEAAQGKGMEEVLKAAGFEVVSIPVSKTKYMVGDDARVDNDWAHPLDLLPGDVIIMRAKNKDGVWLKGHAVTNLTVSSNMKNYWPY